MSDERHWCHCMLCNSAQIWQEVQINSYPEAQTMAWSIDLVNPWQSHDSCIAAADAAVQCQSIYNCCPTSTAHADNAQTVHEQMNYTNLDNR